MARVCELCGRSQSTGFQYARRGLAKAKGGVGKKVTGRTKRTFKPNIQSVRVVEKGRHMRRRVCTRCIKSGRVRKIA